MLSAPTPRAAEMEGTAVLRIVVSSDSMKNATATSHGSRRRDASEGAAGGALGPAGAGIELPVTAKRYRRRAPAQPSRQRARA